MKIVLASISVLLSALVVYLLIQNRSQERELKASYDTLRDLKWQQDRVQNKTWTNIGENGLELNDSIVEIHRIWSTLGGTNYVLRLECRKNGSLWSVMKQFTLKNPLTGEGKTEVLASKSRLANLNDLTDFKSQLSKIPLLTAAISGEDIMCCFGGGSITWEARMPDGKPYRFSTFCGTSADFAKACEELMENCGLSELKSR